MSDKAIMLNVTIMENEDGCYSISGGKAGGLNTPFFARILQHICHEFGLRARLEELQDCLYKYAKHGC